MNKPDIHRLLEFQRLLLAFNQVDRMVHRKHGEEFVYENDTEHSYNLAMTAWFLAEYFPHLDRDKLIRYALVPDLVEVHAGDTYVFDSLEKLKSKQEREDRALEKLRKDWADFATLAEQISAYEKRDSEEARFIYALDKIMPILQIYIHDGHTWKHEGVSREQLHAVKRDKVAVSAEINNYYEQLYDLLLKNEHLFKP